MEELEIPLTTGLIINRDMIHLPNFLRKELEDNFELVEDDEESNVTIHVSTQDISSVFKEFLNDQDRNYFGYSRGDEFRGNMYDILDYYTNE